MFKVMGKSIIARYTRIRPGRRNVGRVTEIVY